MKTRKSPTIIILGAHGMLGHTVYNFLKKLYPSTTWGTTRKTKNRDSHMLNFDALKLNKIEIISKKAQNIDYIINCIGVLANHNNTKEMNFINAVLPHKLADLAKKNNAKLIHVSTDAVFSQTSGIVDELVSTSPNNTYARTKLKGEPLSSNAITIRTSIIGLDPYKHKGLLEWVLKEKNIVGFTNQLWSGCTTLQFAKLCHFIISTNSFQKMRDKSPIFHFSPISNITKHDIIKTFLSLQKSNKPARKAKDHPITRVLKTRYADLLFLDKQEMHISDALKKLMDFEKVAHTKQQI